MSNSNSRASMSIIAKALAGAASASRLITARLPRYTPQKIAGELIARAGIARDTNRFELAAWLYEEALRVTPGRPRVHIQSGHAYKEAGNFPAAEAHYQEALLLLPDDMDLALQLGHFYKVALRHEEAEAAYQRALQLRPGWKEAADELARLQGGSTGDGAGDAWIVPELLPRPASIATYREDRIEVRRLAPRRMQYRGGIMKMLTGIESIRGFAVSSNVLTDVQILLDGREIIRKPLGAFPVRGTTTQRKYVFNIWHDFTDVAPGEYRLELRMLGPSGRGPVHRDRILVAPPTGTYEDTGSDALVPPLPKAAGPIIDEINALPSMIRPAKRSVLPKDIRTILVQRADQLGDLVCSVPAIKRMREMFPAARLIGLLTSANADLGHMLGLFDEIVVADFAEDADAGRRTMTAAAQDRLRTTLQPYSFDLAIDLCEASDSRPLLLLSGAHFLYGFRSQGRSLLSADFEMHARDPVNGLETISPPKKILALVESLGALRIGGRAEAPRSELRRDLLVRYGIGPGERFVVLHTGARLAYTRWPGFTELTALLLERTDLKIVLLQDVPNDVDDLPPSDRLCVLTGRLPFEDFDTLLSSCSVMVGNDSGIKHLAALRGTPTVSLHMARLNWNEWGQENSGTIISRRVPCAGCAIHHNDEECGQELACIRAIRADEVYNAVLDLLK